MTYRGSMKLELIRKAAHVLTGIMIILAFQAHLLTLPSFGILILFFAALTFYNMQIEVRFFTKIFSLNRVDVAVPGLNALFYLIGSWIVLALFVPHIAYAAILILAFGDAVASLISKSFGATQTFITQTTYLEGTAAGIVAGTLAAWIYVPLVPALIASAVAMIIEAGELHIGNHHLDDNLSIPVVAGLVLFVIDYIVPFAHWWF